MQENAAAPRVGRDILVAHERAALERAKSVTSTCVASMQNIAAPDSESVLMWVKCQSLASPFSAEYWHIGATMMRFGSFRPRSWIGENKALMRGFPKWERATLASI